MTTLTAIYAADKAGNLTDPMGKCWNFAEDRVAFRARIRGKAIVCGRLTFERDWWGLTGAKKVVILTRQGAEVKGALADAMKGWQRRHNELCGENAGFPWRYNTIGAVLASLRRFAGADGDALCVGGKKTLEAFAPFYTRIMVTEIGGNRFDKQRVWLPGVPASLDDAVFRGIYGQTSCAEFVGYRRRIFKRHEKVEF